MNEMDLQQTKEMGKSSSTYSSNLYSSAGKVEPKLQLAVCDSRKSKINLNLKTKSIWSKYSRLVPIFRGGQLLLPPLDEHPERGGVEARAAPAPVLVPRRDHRQGRR